MSNLAELNDGSGLPVSEGFGEPEETPTSLIYRALDSVSSLVDPLEKAQAATAMSFALLAASEELKDLRHAAVVSMRDDWGWGYQHIGDQLGIGKARVAQLYKSYEAPKRPGVIEVETKLAVAQMRGAGATDEQIVDKLVPKIRSYKAGNKIETARIAELLQVPTEWLAKYLKTLG